MAAARVVCNLVLLATLSSDLFPLTSSSVYLPRTPMSGLCGQSPYGVLDTLVLRLEYQQDVFYRDGYLTHDCGVHFRTAPNWRLIIIMLNQKLVTTVRGDMCNMFVKIRNGNRNDSNVFQGNVCGKSRVLISGQEYQHISVNGKVLITDTEDAFINFYAENFRAFSSEILITPFYTGHCRMKDYLCENQRCLPYSQECQEIHQYNLCGYTTSRGDVINCDITSEFEGAEYIIIVIIMSVLFIVVAISMCCCCYRCRQKRHQRRRRREERRERRRQRDSSVSIEMSVGLSNLGTDFSFDATLPPYTPTYSPPAYSTLPRCHTTPVHDDDKPPDDDDTVTGTNTSQPIATITVPDYHLASIVQPDTDNVETTRPSALINHSDTTLPNASS